jgi:MSHA biogenesis protein MshM
MYLEHFRLKEFPFGITPDTDFFFASAASQGALNTLLVAVRSGEGFIKITGEVGMGKTLLCRQLLRSLGEDYVTAYVPNPHLSPLGLLLELAEELGVEVEQLGAAARMQRAHLLLKLLKLRLLSLALEGKRILVCLDEVQAMPIKTLEALRLLTNLETEKRKLVQVVIFGQPELDHRLNHRSIRQLKQRITFDHHLGPMSSAELSRYLDHRMSLAGHDGPSVFSPAAKALVRWRTGGTPRLVNIIAHKALMVAYGRGLRRLGLREVLAAVEDTASLRIGAPRVAFASLAAVGLLGLLIVELARKV